MPNTITYDKPFKTYDELIDLLKKRNVIITDEEFAKKCLSDISYYHLINRYKDLYPINQNDEFEVPVPFLELYNLYRFDTYINNVIFKYIIDIEKSLKSKISYIISKEYGVYTDISDLTNTKNNDYLNKSNYRNSRQTQSVLKDIKEAVSSSKNESIQHYKVNHNHIPSWIAINGISFGLTLKWYDILVPEDKNYVCEKLLDNTSLTLEEKKEFIKKGLIILRKYRNNIAHGHKIFSNPIREELPKRQVLSISKNLITNTDYLKGIGKNDLVAVILTISSILDKNSKDLFFEEIISILNIFNKTIFSTGKSLFQMLKLPNNIIYILEQLNT